jgi:TrmH family RNA methyltransferase
MASDLGPDHPDRRVEAVLVEIGKLSEDRNYRDACSRLFVEGVRNLVAAVDNGFSIEHLVVSNLLLTSSIGKKLVRNLRLEGISDTRVSPEQFRQVSRTPRASGVGAIVCQKPQSLHQIRPRIGTCWIVLTRVRSPGNFGCLVRTSAAVGGAGFILMGESIDPFDPAVVRATMGALFRQTFVRTGARQLHNWVRRHKLQIVGVSPDGATDYYRLRYRSPPVFVLGEERRGLDAEQRELCEEVVRIPMEPGTDSLNLAVAGSLLMYEAFRSCRSRPVRRRS